MTVASKLLTIHLNGIWRKTLLTNKLEPILASQLCKYITPTGLNLVSSRIPTRCFSSRKDLTESRGGGEIQPSLGEKVKESTKTASYGAVILLGLGVTAFILFTVFRELLSSKSANSVYGEALKRCRNEARIVELLGEPIKGYGEETRRGRRAHVTHLEYIKDGVTYLRMKFYIQGSRKKGTVNLEMKEDASGKYEYRYLFVEVDDFVRPAVIVLEDNR